MLKENQNVINVTLSNVRFLSSKCLRISINNLISNILLITADKVLTDYRKKVLHVVVLCKMLIRQQVYKKISENGKWHVELFSHLPLHMTPLEQILHLMASSCKNLPALRIVFAVGAQRIFSKDWAKRILFSLKTKR